MFCRALDGGVLGSEQARRCYDFAADTERVAIPSLVYSGGKISFRVKTTETQGVFLGTSGISTYLLAVNNTDSVTSLSQGMGTPSHFVDGVSIGTTNRANAYQKICNGIEHLIEITNISFTGGINVFYYDGTSYIYWNTKGKIWDFKIDINNNGILDAWYKMDEGAGATAIDSSGNNRNATITSSRLTSFHSFV